MRKVWKYHLTRITIAKLLNDFVNTTATTLWSKGAFIAFTVMNKRNFLFDAIKRKLFYLFTKIRPKNLAEIFSILIPGSHTFRIKLQDF